ncbi:hypothetical protein TBK1r_72880 [Stieleria magnilauensis]|uniref:Transmembrane protein n=2 Tax=Stieleria magnilauensis TaxID=2527963 RepID=A0ABX5Y2L6_9BACT|nr:hypothetical protein TBK1r_72880 [Planctomycetes bacterium TBK1r]
MCMSEESPTEHPSSSKPQFSIRGLLKFTSYSAVLIYIVWRSWGHLGSTALLFLLLSPFIFFAEIVDWILGVKKR